MAKIEITCPCGKIFLIKANEIKRCPGCGRPHRGPVTPKEFIIHLN